MRNLLIYAACALALATNANATGTTTPTPEPVPTSTTTQTQSQTQAQQQSQAQTQGQDASVRNTIEGDHFRRNPVSSAYGFGQGSQCRSVLGVGGQTLVAGASIGIPIGRDKACVITGALAYVGGPADCYARVLIEATMRREKYAAVLSRYGNCAPIPVPVYVPPTMAPIPNPIEEPTGDTRRGERG